MPVNNQSIGKDVTVNINLFGKAVTIQPNAIMEFEPTPRTSEETRTGIDGVTRDAVFPIGWSLQFQIDRLDGVVEDMWASIEAAYYAGQNVGTGTVLETITNPDGSINQWQYTPVVFKLESLGQRTATSVIKMRMSALAGRRIKQ